MRFGSRGPNEWDIHAPTWGTRPEIALVAVDRMRALDDDASPVAHGRQLAAERVRLMDELVAFGRARAGRAAPSGACARVRSSWPGGSGPRRTSSRRSTRSVSPSSSWAPAWSTAACSTMPATCACCSTPSSTASSPTPAATSTRINARTAEHAELYELEPPWVVNGAAPPLSTWTRRAAVEVAPVAAGDVLHGGASAPAWPPASHASCCTQPTPRIWSPGRCSSRRSLTRHGRRCSSPPAR